MLNLQKRKKKGLSQKMLKFISIETKCKPFMGIIKKPKYQGYAWVSFAET